MPFSDGIAAVIELFVSASRYSKLTTISMRARTVHCEALTCPLPHSLSPFLLLLSFVSISIAAAILWNYYYPADYFGLSV